MPEGVYKICSVCVRVLLWTYLCILCLLICSGLSAFLSVCVVDNRDPPLFALFFVLRYIVCLCALSAAQPF